MKWQDLAEAAIMEVATRLGEYPNTTHKLNVIYEAIRYGNIEYFNQEAHPNSPDGIRHRIFLMKAESYYRRKAFDLHPSEIDDLKRSEYNYVWNLKAQLGI